MALRSFVRDQVWIFPPTLDELIPADHVVRFVASFVDGLDLQALGLRTTQTMGAPAYSPYVLAAAWIYGFMMGLRSSRKLEIAAQESIPLMWLLGGERPDHSTLSRFFQENKDGLNKLFRQTVLTAVRVGLVDFALQAVDGTKISALSKDKTFSAADLVALGQKVDETMAHLEKQVASDEASSAGPGQARHMPASLADAQRLKEQIKAALQEMARREAERTAHHKGATDAKTGEQEGPKVHLADPSAVLMKGRHGFVLGYNGQAVVDGHAGIVVAADVVASATDTGQLLPMIREAEANTGRAAEATTADAGYHSAQNLAEVEKEGREVYVADPAAHRSGQAPEQWAYHKDHFIYEAGADCYRCPEGQELTFAYTMKARVGEEQGVRVYQCHACAACPHRGECTTDHLGRRVHIGPHEEELKRSRLLLQTERAREALKQRGRIVEPVFGLLRERQGLTRFLRRGLANVRAEWHLLCATYNLLKIWRLQWRTGLAAP
jgi:transposase